MSTKKPINRIQVITTGDCPTGSETVVLGTWDGTVQGCLCGTTLYAGPCTSSSSSCSTVSAYSPTSFTKYAGVQYCVTRVASWTNPNASGACASGKLCAADICVPTTETCPITDIRILLTANTASADYTEVTLNTTAKLVYSNTYPSQAVTFLKVSLYDNPCMDPAAMPFTTSKKPYVLSAVQENGCGGTGTVENLEYIERKAASDLFSENNMNAIVTGLPGFSTYITGEFAYFVGARQYLVETTAGCPVISSATLTNTKNYEESFVNNIYGILIAGIVLMSVIFFLIIIEMVFHARKNEEEAHWVRFFSALTLLALLGACVLFIIIGGVAAHTKVKLSSDVAILNYLASHQCFKQEVVNRTLQVLRGNVSNFYAILWLSISLMIIACAGIVTTIIIGLVNIGYAKRTGGFSSYYRSVGKKLKRKGKTQGPRGMGQQSGTGAANIEMLISNKTVV